MCALLLCTAYVAPPIASPHNCCHCNSWLGNWWKLADGVSFPSLFLVYWTTCHSKWTSVGITFIKLKMGLNILLPVLKTQKKKSGKIMRAPRATWQSCANVFDLFPLLLLCCSSTPLRDDDDLYNLVAPRRMLHNNKEAKSKLLTGTASSDLRNNKTKSSSTALHDPAAQSTPTPTPLLGLTFKAKALHTLRLVGAVRQKTASKHFLFPFFSLLYCAFSVEM